MLHKGRPIAPEQPWHHRREPLGQGMHGLADRPVADAQLALKLSERTAVQIMLYRHDRQQPIAQ